MLNPDLYLHISQIVSTASRSHFNINYCRSTGLTLKW